MLDPSVQASHTNWADPYRDITLQTGFHREQGWLFAYRKPAKIYMDPGLDTELYGTGFNPCEQGTEGTGSNQNKGTRGCIV